MCVCVCVCVRVRVCMRVCVRVRGVRARVCASVRVCVEASVRRERRCRSAPQPARASRSAVASTMPSTRSESAASASSAAATWETQSHFQLCCLKGHRSGREERGSSGEERGEAAVGRRVVLPVTTHRYVAPHASLST